MKHELKTLTEYFKAAASGQKTFEVRLNDRDYKVGDILILKEWDPDKAGFTGEILGREVIYALDDPLYVKEGYIILGIEVWS